MENLNAVLEFQKNAQLIQNLFKMQIQDFVGGTGEFYKQSEPSAVEFYVGLKAFGFLMLRYMHYLTFSRKSYVLNMILISVIYFH